jgi:Skp family chaperone for outer membrane proteins
MKTITLLSLLGLVAFSKGAEVSSGDNLKTNAPSEAAKANEDHKVPAEKPAEKPAENKGKEEKPAENKVKEEKPAEIKGKEEKPAAQASENKEENKKNEPEHKENSQGGVSGQQSNQNQTRSDNSDAESISQLKYVEKTFDKVVPVPIVRTIPAEQPLLIQNNGFGLFARKSGSSYSIEVSSVTTVSEQQSWRYRSNGLIVNVEANQCLWRMESGGVGLCGCEDSRVGYWNVDIAKGTYTERTSNQVLYMEKTTVITKKYSEITSSSSYSVTNAQWSTYRMVQRSEYKAPVLIKVRPRATDILSIQQSGFFLVAKRSQQTIQIVATQQPPQLQYQTWVLLENGRMKNMEFGLCLKIDSATGLVLVDCEDQKVGIWEYKYELRVFREQTSNNALYLEGQNVSVKEFSEKSLSTQYKWEAYGTAAALSAEDNSATLLISKVSSAVIGLMSLYFLSFQ